MDQSVVKDFKVDLQYSLEAGESEMFDNFYRRVFPHLKSIEICEDIERQMDGIDKILTLINGKEICVDEKKRRKDYGDILLEEYSDFDNKKVGWLGKHKKTDYVVYAIMPVKKVYLLPFLILQKVWLKHYPKFLLMYGRSFSQNKNYRTSNIAIPTELLLELIKNEMVDDI